MAGSAAKSGRGTGRRGRRRSAALSPTPDRFDALRAHLGAMQRSQPNLSAAELAAIQVPVWSVIGENDEFIRRDHAEYIAASIPGAVYREIPKVSHFAPLQRPASFNATLLEFLTGLAW